VNAVDHSVLKRAYDAFNARDVESVLATMHPEVDWPNGWEGGRVHGHRGIRDYWTRQWAAIDPHVEAMRFQIDDTGRTIVDVHTIVRDRTGRVIVDEMVQHVYTMESGLIRSMEIRKL
jgi:hypothetical protein